MKKKLGKISGIAMICIMILTSFAPVSFAADKVEPELKTFGGTEYFFANGVAITIEAREDGSEGALIKWDGGEQNVGKNANVLGGMHDDATSVSTSITMNGGTVRNVIGGGLHKSNCSSTNIVINGGNMVAVQGGGASSLTKDCGCSNASWYNGNAKDSPCQVENANVTINGGSVSSLVFGGGEGISCTKNSSLTINDGSLGSAWVTAGGSNGYTGSAKLSIKGGDLNVVQSVNRGSMDSAEIEVTGGTIKDLYLGGETGDSNVTGSISNIKTTIDGGKIGTLSPGKSNNTEIVMKDNENVNLDFKQGEITNVDENIKVDVCTHEGNIEFKVEKVATCTEDGLKVGICKICGERVTEKVIPKLGHKWNKGEVIKEATYTEKGEIKYTCLNDPTHTKIEYIPMLVKPDDKPVVAPDKNTGNDNKNSATGNTKVTSNPKTGDSGMLPYILISLVSLGGFGFVLKKKFI